MILLICIPPITSRMVPKQPVATQKKTSYLVCAKIASVLPPNYIIPVNRIAGGTPAIMFGL